MKIAGEHVPPELIEALRRVPGVSQASAEDGVVRLLAPDANRALAEVVAAAGGGQTGLRDIPLIVVNLDQGPLGEGLVGGVNRAGHGSDRPDAV